MEYLLRIIHKDTNKLLEQIELSDEETQGVLSTIGRQINKRGSLGEEEIGRKLKELQASPA
jgi:predicted DCC family thiol-disulfide oxidoreductase YuxK